MRGKNSQERDHYLMEIVAELQGNSIPEENVCTQFN